MIVIDHGLVIADDTATRLKSSLGDLVSLGFASAHDAAAAAARAERVEGASVSVTGSDVAIRVAHGRDLAPSLVGELAGAGAPVLRMEVVGPTLDDVFLDLTGRSLREPGSETPTTEGAAA